MLGQLVPCGGGPALPLFQPRLVVGRHRACDLPLAFSTVSSRHCELEFRDGYWHVRDLGSSNGTRINGKPCTSGRLLPNDILSVATLRYRLVYSAPEAGQWVPQRAAPPAPRAGAPTHPNAAEPAKRALPKVPAGSASEASLGELVPCGGGDPVPLLKPLLLVGRHPDCDVVLRHGTVSAHHCELEWNNGYWFVRDLGSQNGVRVDGFRCQSRPLPNGSVLWVGSLRYQVVYAGAGSGKPSVFGQSLLEKAGLTGRDLADLPGEHDKRPGEADDKSVGRYRLDEDD